MAVIKVKKDFSGGLEYLKNACNYICNPERAIGWSGNGVDPYHPGICYEQMLAVKKYYSKTSTNPLVHFIVSCNVVSAPDAKTAVSYTRRIAEFFQQRYQSLQCTHKADHDCSWFHGHILVNSVSFVDGLMLSTDSKTIDEFSKWVEYVTRTKSYVEFWSKEKDEAYQRKKKNKL